MYEPDALDDSPEYRPPPSLARRLKSVPRGAWGGAAAVIALLAAVPLLSGLTPFKGDYHVHLHGPGVDHLVAGAPVALGIQRIGQVTRVETREGRLTADVALQRLHAQELPADAVFLVASLNDWLPGNVGVRVRVVESGGPFEPLADGAVIRTPEQFLPIEIPPRFYLLIGAALGALVIAFVIARLMLDWARGAVLVFVVAAVIAVVVMSLNGTISPPSWDVNPADFLK